MSEGRINQLKNFFSSSIDLANISNHNNDGSTSSDEAKTWAKNKFSTLKDESTGVQICVGFVTGLVTEKIMEKVGKSAAIILVTGLVVCKVAHHAGYIDMDWARLRHKAAETTGRFVDTTGKSLPSSKQVHNPPKKVIKFAEDNAVLSSSFGGGFFVGFMI